MYSMEYLMFLSLCPDNLLAISHVLEFGHVDVGVSVRETCCSETPPQSPYIPALTNPQVSIYLNVIPYSSILKNIYKVYIEKKS